MSPSFKAGRLTLSDRASAGIYSDLSGPTIESIIADQFETPIDFHRRLIPDERPLIESTLIELCDAGCSLVITTGGTGPTPRDLTPEATRAIVEKELPGFGEIMRARSFATVPTAILSRATAGIRGRSLIINLPGKPAAVSECLPMLLPAIVECIHHITGFRPVLKKP
jgi:molybdopterin adenylyltransferase